MPRVLDSLDPVDQMALREVRQTRCLQPVLALLTDQRFSDWHWILGHKLYRVHSLIDAVYARTPVEEFRRRVRIHPNVSELLPTVLEHLEVH